MKKYELGEVDEAYLRLLTKTLDRRLPEGSYQVKGFLGKAVICEDNVSSDVASAIKECDTKCGNFKKEQTEKDTQPQEGDKKSQGEEE